MQGESGVVPYGDVWDVQVEVIKKAYQQESECEGGEVSPREVGHNIYILGLQVTPSLLSLVSLECHDRLSETCLHVCLCVFACLSLPDTTRIY